MEEIKAIEDLEEELCDYCPLEDYQKGVHCYGGEPVMCEGSHCDEAYENYVDDMEDQMKEEFGELTSKDFMHMSTEDIEKIAKTSSFRCSLPNSCSTCAFGSSKGNCWCLSNSAEKPTPTYRQEQCLKELNRRSEKTDYITDMNILMQMDGVAVTCTIEGVSIQDAVISVNSTGKCYVCQNVYNGWDVKDKKGYKYSWEVRDLSGFSGDLNVLKIRRKEDALDIQPLAKPQPVLPIMLEALQKDPLLRKGILSKKSKEKKKYKPEDYPSIDWKSRSKTKRKKSLITEW